MEERRRNFIDLDSSIGNLALSTEKRLTTLEVSNEKMEEDLKDIKRILEKLSDKLNLAEDDIWQDLNEKEKSFNERLVDLEKSKASNKGFLAALAIASGTGASALYEKVIKLMF